MNIHQMQITYNAAEDRLILKLNSQENEEIRLFLTRRITLSLLDMLAKTIDHSLNKQMINKMKKSIADSNFEPQATTQQIQRQDIVDKTDSETPFKGGEKFPIGKTPMLIEKITINVHKNNMIEIIFANDKEGDVRLDVNRQLLHNLSDLLTQIMPSTDWNARLMSNNSVLMPETSGKSALH
ncbi:hypothetical protein SPBRAN_1976 [uncultured Candidatus Thioglobus sp.]|nr:hypothetical protein SPBRAN_1976 [uncultured Candidatus Thioglobus sp.]